MKKVFNEIPFYNTKLNFSTKFNIWNFTNIYNHYFCFCKGFNCSYNINQICKYKFYLYIIDQNRFIYNKTDYLLADFLGVSESSDDAYPIFNELIKRHQRAHYMTKKKNIYINHCKYTNKKCMIIINTTFINGNFLEIYLELFLRLKVAIAGSEFLSMDNIFYNIEYITFISLTHGINYFKVYLYNGYYSPRKYNKIVASTSNKIINLIKENGWNEDNIIKICFPKWDIYETNANKLLSNGNSNSNSIFLFFTWRNWKNKTNKNNINSISPFYFRNIFRLINNYLLKKEIKIHKISLYFGFHHMFERYKKNIKIKNKKIKFVEQNEIFDILRKTNLLITDFSSIIFDMIYQRKPYIMYIPDSDDPNIISLYDFDYYNLINRLRNGELKFENKFFIINEVINKIIYYIHRNFKLEKRLRKFYNSFGFKCKNSTQSFINYLVNLI